MKYKVLLPTDFSDNSRNAINYALELFANEPCDFYLMNAFSSKATVIDILLNAASGNELLYQAEKKSKKELSKVLDKLILSKSSDFLHQFKMVSVFNNPVKAIKELIEKKDIDIVVMGTKGETNNKGTIFGSIAVQVMEKVRNCPVIVVPLKAIKKIPKEIVFPTSFKTHYKKRELRYLIDIAKKCNATIAILHISQDKELSKIQKDNKKLLSEILEEVPITFHFLSHFDVEPALNMFVESRNSDMVTFINKKHAFFGSILTKPMVKGISFHSKVPILVLHDLRN